MKTSTRVRICRYQPSCVLKVTGEDALSFLQGQFTQDLKKAEPKGAAYGLWLNQKGKIVADSVVIAGGDGVWWVVSALGRAAAIRDRLERYIIADDVGVEDETGNWEGVFVVGPGSKEWLNGVPGYVWPGRRGQEENWEWLKPKEVALPAQTFEEVSPETVERWRIAAGIPAVGRDLGEDDLPNEAGLEEVAISYTKGCYLGQEVMARLKTLGRVRRRLLRVAGGRETGMPEALPAALFRGDKQVGELRSVVAVEDGWRGLAMISLLGLAGEKTLSLSAGQAPQVHVEDSLS